MKETYSVFAVRRFTAGIVLAGLLQLPGVTLAESGDSLEAGFDSPPLSARPRTWWHWMNGNVTIDGIEKDLEWMHEVGLGGIQTFDANLNTPQIVDERLVYMTPEWREAFDFAVNKADELGLEFAIAASPGWSETGGPWVPPEDGMKKLVWSQVDVSGGVPFKEKLPQPPVVTGAYKDLEFHNPLAAIEGDHGKPQQYYADALVLAFPLDRASVLQKPAETRSIAGVSLDGGALSDQSLKTGVDIEAGTPQDPPGIIVSYRNPQTISSATLFIPNAVIFFGDPLFSPSLESLVDGNWKKVADFPVSDVPVTISFAPVSASEFRVVLHPYDGPKRLGLGEGAEGAAPGFSFPSGGGDTVRVADFQLASGSVVDQFELKAGFDIALDYYAMPTSADAEEVGVDPDSVVDLTEYLQPDGTLEWTPPAGDWRILRLGYSLTGKTNHPATPEATGLEVDKYDGAAVRRYLETYLGMYEDAAPGDWDGSAGLDAILTDSIEVGPSNWTPRIVEQFRKLRGYDPVPWLPALVGTIVGTRQQSDAFLYDFRLTLGDLLVSEHYGTVSAVAAEHGISVYGEALEDVRPTLGDDMKMRSHTTVPMAALWLWNRDSQPRPTLLGDMKGASSVAHVYGQNIAAAESMTAANSPWAFAPSDLRRVIDLEFAYGINRPVIHTSVHQPLDDQSPGLTLAIFGQYFNRHESWAPLASAWVDYMSRNSFMLQQGRNFADVAYFYGEERPLTTLFAFSKLPDTPTQHAYDFINADALLNLLSVEGGKLVAPSGASYEVLYLGGTSNRMTLPVLEKIAELAEAGATVIGNAPTSSPSLADDEVRFKAVTARLWKSGSRTRVGRGQVISGVELEDALATLELRADLAIDAAAEDEFLFVHRLLDDGHAYFVNNRQNEARSVNASFRVTGLKPEIWRADTGAVEDVSYRMGDGVTTLPLDFGPEDSFYVVFREPTTRKALDVPETTEKVVGGIEGPWAVEFQSGRGAPDSIRLDDLESLIESDDPGVRYFSGLASYRNKFTTSDVPDGSSLWLDLGDVGELAEVIVNGESAGITWFAPFRVDISGLVKRGENTVEIRVANLWVNRLIGDKQPDADQIAFTPAPTYNPDTPLRKSGLIGPVLLVEVGNK